MNFTYPSILFALCAIAIPIIIHLFNFRKFKTVYFSSVKFLKEVKQETQSKSRIKHLLVLLARILTIASLVVAFAQPFIPAKKKQTSAGSNAISIFVDNSFSMESINKNGTLLDDAKRKAIEIISAYKASDKYQLLTNDFEPKHQRLVNKEQFIELLDEVKISASSHNAGEILARQFDALNQMEAANKFSFLISDFQKSLSSLDKFKNDTTVSIHFIPIEATEKSNVYIDSCWFTTPVRQFNHSEQLHVRIKNESQKQLENYPIKLYINGKQKTLATFNCDKNSEVEIILSYISSEKGIHHCKAELNDYPITFDDVFYFSYFVNETIPVGLINTDISSKYISKLLASDSMFSFTQFNATNIDYALLSKQQFVVLNELKTIPTGLIQELVKMIENGKSILLIPTLNADLASYNDFLKQAKANYFSNLDTSKTQVDKINFDNIIYKDVFDKKTFNSTNLNLPIVYKHFVFTKQTQTNEEYLLRLQNGDTYISKYALGKGQLFVCASGLFDVFGNFAKHAIFVPTIFQMAILSQASAQLFYSIGKDETVQTNGTVGGDNVFKVKSIDNDFEIIPEHKVKENGTEIYLRNQLKSAGCYDVFVQNNLVQGIALNYNRSESQSAFLTADELKTNIEKYDFANIQVLESGAKSLSVSLTELDQGVKLWKLFLLFALIFLAIEIALIRLLK
jgi:hypothetical protein